MSMQVTVTLPDDTYRRAKYVAQLTSRDVADVLVDMIDQSLHPLGRQPDADTSVAELSDTDVLIAADAQMDVGQNKRLGELLEKQQAGPLSDDERQDLSALLQVYQEGLLRKARALSEAVRRGLRAPLTP